VALPARCTRLLIPKSRSSFLVLSDQYLDSCVVRVLSPAAVPWRKRRPAARPLIASKLSFQSSSLGKTPCRIISPAVSRKWALFRKTASESPMSWISTKGPRIVGELAEPNKRIGLQSSLTTQLLHLWRAVDVVGLPIRTLQHQITASRSFLLTVHKILPSMAVRSRATSVVIGSRSSDNNTPCTARVFCRFGSSLHRSKHLLGIAPH
jgi:hypothetical protein